MNYHYPIDETWTKEEVIDVVKFFSLIEKAYESKVNREEVLLQYNRFKQVVPSKSEEKTLLKQFEKQSGYVGYLVLKKAKEADGNFISMK
ncbi:UPF0223 family protein [Virgibacillus sp. YIM 98842]|uniref:UPF0223 family protein n=1 Tax=Virgibacillus sp. YIM 98842 TaxID=2663533 RepID=UPI0013D8E47E|nr:UPF0223 family protein [Virgibacillus sp. YIM 98842]